MTTLATSSTPPRIGPPAEPRPASRVLPEPAPPVGDGDGLTGPVEAAAVRRLALAHPSAAASFLGDTDAIADAIRARHPH